MQTAEIKDKQGLVENLFLNKVLIQSLKETKESQMLPEGVNTKQKNLFLAAVAFESKVAKDLGLSREDLSSTKFTDLSVIIQLLAESTPNTDYIIQSMIEFLRVLMLASKTEKKLDPNKYKLFLDFVTKELQVDMFGGESALSVQNNTLVLGMKSPKPNINEEIYGTE